MKAEASKFQIENGADNFPIESGADVLQAFQSLMVVLGGSVATEGE